MKLSELRIELDKAQGWAGGGDPDVYAGERAILFAKIVNGSINLEVDDPEQMEELRSLEEEIKEAEDKIESLEEDAKDEARDAIDEVVGALERTLERIPDTDIKAVIEDEIRILEQRRRSL